MVGLGVRGWEPFFLMNCWDVSHFFFSADGSQQCIYAWNPKQPFINGCLVKQSFFYIKIWNHPIGTTIYKWLFGVPGVNVIPIHHRLLIRIVDSI